MNHDKILNLANIHFDGKQKKQQQKFLLLAHKILQRKIAAE